MLPSFQPLVLNLNASSHEYAGTLYVRYTVTAHIGSSPSFSRNLPELCHDWHATKAASAGLFAEAALFADL